jgi:hypothetical protein
MNKQDLLPFLLSLIRYIERLIHGYHLFQLVTYLFLSYLLTAWSWVLLEKLTGLQLLKKFPAFCETRKLITAFTSARHLSLSSASSIQSINPHPTSWRSILILSYHLRLGLICFTCLKCIFKYLDNFITQHFNSTSVFWKIILSDKCQLKPFLPIA